MKSMLLTGSGQLDAEQAFTRAARGRLRAAVMRRLRRADDAAALPVFSEGTSVPAGGGVREIPVEAIRGTVEPSRAALFDCAFRPARAAGMRWQRLWLAEHRGGVLPPISVVPVCGGYAVRDGHHRVSVARARGALTIDACVEL